MWICVQVCICAICMCVKVGGNLWESVCPSIIWVPGSNSACQVCRQMPLPTELPPIPSLLETCYLAQAILELVTILLLSVRITGMYHNAQHFCSFPQAALSHGAFAC